MIVDLLVLACGLLLLVGGGDGLVRGATRIAQDLRVSPLVVGLTVVAFGTSAPELTVNVLAAWRGSGALSFGNIMGSNMANVGLIVGCAALVRPLRVRRFVVRTQIPMMLAATAAAVVLALDPWLGEPPGQYDRGDGLALLVLFGVFLYYTISSALRERARHHGKRDAPQAPQDAWGRNLLLTLGSLVILCVGAKLTVEGAVALARAFDASEALIGVTIVAVGTSLPELAAAVAAASRGHPDLVVGNVVGSNVFNLLLVAGASGVARPVPVPPWGLADLGAMALLSVLLLLVSVSRRHRIVRGEAVFLLTLYMGYVAWRSLHGVS